MNILDFYNEADEDKKRVNEYFGTLLSEKQVTLQEYEYCIDIVNSGMLLKNTQIFDNIMKNKKIPDNLQDKIKLYNCSDLVTQMETERQNVITFNKERKEAIKKIFEIIHQNDKSLFGMYGYAGTGKTTLIMEVIQFLIIHNLVKSVVLTAPTHKALNVMKTNFQKLIPHLLENKKLKDQGSFENNIMELRFTGINIDFITIHKLLGYEIDFSKSGERIFKKKEQNIKNKKFVKEYDICKYDLVIIDECSMISMKMIIEIFKEIKLKTKSNDYKQIPKIIFTGDPAQLPPVNEKSSSIFIKDIKEFSLSDYLRNNPIDESTFMTQDMVKVEYEKIVNDIIQMETVTLKQIFRNKRTNVLDLCFNIRQWVNGEIKVPTLGKFKGNGVLFYKFNNVPKIETKWFQKCIEMIQEGKSSNIVLTWTNAASDLYNNEIRKIIFNKIRMNPYEIGDILMLNDFYCFNDTENDADETQRFYTSEQLKILELKTVERKIPLLSDSTITSAKTIQNVTELVKKYITAVNQINQLSKNIYKTWKMKVVRLAEKEQNNLNEYHIYVIHEQSKKQLEDDSENIVRIIKNLLKSYQQTHTTQIRNIEKSIMKPLWKYWNNNYVAPFANVIFGYSITTHKAQGSTFNNVFIDAEDILQNSNTNEAKRCIYTAHTRGSNEIHILA